MREQLNNADLVDIRDVRVNSSLPKQERVAEYVRQIKYPNRYRCGEYTITAIHPDNGPSIEDCLQRIAGGTLW